MKKWSLHAVARELGVHRSTIARTLKRHGVVLRSYQESVDLLPKKIGPEDIKRIREMYWVDKMSSAQIGRQLGVNGSWIRTLMVRSGLPRRTTSEAGMRFPKTRFSGDEHERAYLMGFRAGDLNAKIYGYQVRVSTSTTHPAMWRLLLSAFAKNGRANKTAARHREGFEWMIYCYLDRSFTFLLPKAITIPAEYLEKEGLFLSFLAGYVDAEGSFRLSRHRTKKAMSFRINSEDRLLLRDVRRGLTRMGYHVYLALAAKKNLKEGKRYRHSLWSLGMFREREILDLVRKLRVRHDEKVRQVRLLQWSVGRTWREVGPRWLALRATIKREVKDFVAEAKSSYISKHSYRRGVL